MINISDKTKKLYAAEIIPGTITLTINGIAFESGAWLSGSLSITEALCSKDSLDYSSVESNVLEVELASESGNTTGLKGETVSVKQTVNGETVPLGTFTIADATLDGDYFTKLKAYDDMKKFIDSDITNWWNSTVKFPITIHDLLIALCAKVGVATDLPDTWTNATVSVSQTTYVQNFKASELLGMIQEACGLFFHTNRQNKLVVVTGSTPETSIPYTDLVEDAKVSDYTVPAITGVQIKATEKDTGGFYGEKTTVYQIVGNYLLMGKEEAELQSIAKNVLATIGGKSYKPFSAKVKARNYLEVGDPVRITTYKGMTTAAPLLSRKMSDDGLITDELVVKGNPRNGTKPLTNRKILQVYSQKIHEVEETLDGFNSTFEEIKTTQTELGKSISNARSEWKQTANGISQTVSSNYERTVTGQHEEFAQGDSDTTAPADGWSTTQPSRKDGKYIWRRTVTTFGDGTTSTSPGVCITGPKGDKGDTGARGLQGIQGEKGDQGVPGKDGASGKTSYFHIKYSPVAKPTSSSQLSETPSDYIGTYVDFNEADSTDPSKYTWSQFKGSQGPKGDKGIAGTNGVNGKTSYLHIAYATSSDGKTGFSVSKSYGKTYIGQYTDFTESDSTDYTKYSWTLIKGEKGDKGDKGATGERGPQGAQGLQGPKGDQGIQGQKGTDGKSSYTHIAYAASADGNTGFSVSSTANAKYLGVYVDSTSTDSTDPTKYKWTLIKGADGPQGIQGKAGSDGRTPYIHFAYANSADGKTGFNVNYFANALYVGTYTDYTSADSTNYASYSWARLKGDTGAQGAKGDTGATGPKGATGAKGDKGDSITITSSSTTYATSTSSTQPADSAFTSTSIPALAAGDYLWTKVVTNFSDGKSVKSYSVSRIGADGKTGAAGANGKTTHWAYATSADGKTGFSTIMFSGATYVGTYDDTTQADSTDYTKYKWTKLKGDTGAKGADGKGIKSTAVTYQAAPSQTAAPTGTWSGSVPSLSKSNPYLWTRTIITYTDNTTSTSYSVSSAITDPRINSTIIKHEQEYYLSTSDTSLAGGSWSTTFPTRKDGTFYWVRYKDTHANKAVTYDPSANGKLLTEVNEVWNSVVSNQTAINSSNAQINMVATSVTSVKNDLGKKADVESVNSSMDKLSSTVTDIGKQIAELKVKANSIEASVTEVNGLAQATKKATAALTVDGLSVDTGQTTKSVVDGTGLTITSKADNSVVAKFTTGESEIQNLKIDGLMKIGAHVVQKMQDTEWDGTMVNGTGWMWNGG